MKAERQKVPKCKLFHLRCEALLIAWPRGRSKWSEVVSSSTGAMWFGQTARAQRRGVLHVRVQRIRPHPASTNLETRDFPDCRSVFLLLLKTRQVFNDMVAFHRCRGEGNTQCPVTNDVAQHRLADFKLDFVSGVTMHCSLSTSQVCCRNYSNAY